ncbi:aldehyde dehydrogenase family protein [Sodalis-like endosymbiont of Proechinophthirus fluctus]|uniref:aldehyde dehydrogenase family protein n=1 Tax=Sodalis-like endosymbiont of Proechinophthirus fluctus TaxID=1462730 RepID=UPI001958EA66
MLYRFAELIESHADQLVELEVRDNSRLLEDMRHQIRYIPHWYRYYAELANKIEGMVYPCDKLALSLSRH